ncbi:MAG TPA: adenylate/guanylate cyclase domain-containing protein, partial [Chthonomonadaceae bacterium]|nr:adenylate/guanylate cyclase domain-containing protein [Chthonomonadaceae bacterium]
MPQLPSADGGESSLPGGTVTFLLTDIEGSTRLWEAHPAAMQQALLRYEALAENLVVQHRGHLVKIRGEGDSLFCVFADAADALSAACALQQAYQQEPWPESAPIKVRMALHSGEGGLRNGDYYGPTVNRCARLRAIGRGGQVLLSQATQALLREALPSGCHLKSLGRHHLRDLPGPEHVFQLLHPSLPDDFAPLVSREEWPSNLPLPLTRFIGRAQELESVLALLAETRLLTLTGAGGTGKTRLAMEAAGRFADSFPGDVWFVPLADLSAPHLMPAAL